MVRKMKAIYKDNILLGWNLSDKLAKTFQNLGFQIREMTDIQIRQELIRIQQQEINDQELDELLGEDEFFESIE